MRKFLKRFLEYVKGDGEVEYTSVTIGDDFSEGFSELVKKNRNLLTDHGININKVRFVHTNVFAYDMDKNIINPTFTAMLPSKKNAPIIEVGKPDNVVAVKVIEYESLGFNGNYDIIKHLVKKTKRGIVIYVKRYEDAIRDDGNRFIVEEGVDKDVVKLINLDDVPLDIIDESEIIM